MNTVGTAPANFFASIAAVSPDHQQVDLREQGNDGLLHFFSLRTRITDQQHDIATLHIAEVGQTPFECFRIDPRHLGRTDIQVPNAPDLPGLLSGSGYGRCQCHPANRTEKIAPSHSMTSSARARTDGGKIRPIALAAFRLMTNSNLVGW